MLSVRLQQMEAGHGGRDLASKGETAQGRGERGKEGEARKRGSTAAADAAGGMCDVPDQKEAAVPRQRRGRGAREEEKAAEPLNSPPGCKRVQAGSRAGPQPHQQNAR